MKKLTKKEEMYVNILNVRNEYYNLISANDKVVDVANLLENTYRIEDYARKRKMCELEKELEIAKKALEQAREAAARDAWFESEEGKTWKEAKLSERKAAYDEHYALEEAEREYTRKVVRELLGGEFDVTCFSLGSRFEVGLVEKVLDNGTPCAYFGHEFTVYFGKDEKYMGNGNWERTFRWELNYGTMGAFDLINDEKHVKYLVAMAKFASSDVVNNDLREHLKKSTERNMEISKRIYELDDELKNPKIAD